ncbi:hypothetical protein [Mannheimia bovis]|uniref:Uncharacterized protein n=1 Tax=Mannheimia bovis TaxID=2770636 RepID=A0A7H1C2I3_9PAST|nr:hypothetical protein [Mannheimia bovis]QNS15188.1 hypothetical protein ICJ55_00015 [Mannheimia bovis]
MAKRIFDNQGNSFKINLALHNHGISFLNIDYDEVEPIVIVLSDLFTPFDDIADWLLDIHRHQGEHKLVIDEEGRFTSLFAKSINNDELLLNICRAHSDILLATFNKEPFLKLFKNELHRFLRQDFDSQKFGGRYDEQKPLKDNTKERLLNHPFLKSD